MKVVNEKYKNRYLKYKNKYYSTRNNNYIQKGGDTLFYFSSLSIVGIILWFIFKNPKKETNDLKKIEKKINIIPFLAETNDNIRINTSNTNNSSINNEDDLDIDNVQTLPAFSVKDDQVDLGTDIRDDQVDLGTDIRTDQVDLGTDIRTDQDDDKEDDQDFTYQPITKKRGFFGRVYDAFFGENKKNTTEIDDQLLKEHEKDLVDNIRINTNNSSINNVQTSPANVDYELDDSIANPLLKLYENGLYELSEIKNVAYIIIKDKNITLNKALEILQSKYTKIKKNNVVLILDNPNGNAISLAVVDKVNIGNPHTYSCTIVKPLEKDEDLSILISDKQKLFKLPKHEFFKKEGILFYLYSYISNGKNIEERYDKLFKCLDDYYKQSKNKKNTLRPLEKCIEEIFDKSRVSNIQIDEVVDPDPVDDDEVVNPIDPVQDTTLALKYREENKNEEEFMVTFGNKISTINIDEILKMIYTYNVNIETRTDISDMTKSSDITVYKGLTLESENNLLEMNRAYEKGLDSISSAKKKLIQDKYYDIMNLKHLPQPSFLIETQYLEGLYILIDECLFKLENENANLKGAPNSNFMESLSASIREKNPNRFVEISEYILDDIDRIKNFLNEIKSTLNNHKSGFTERLMAIEDVSIYKPPKNNLDTDIFIPGSFDNRLNINIFGRNSTKTLSSNNTTNTLDGIEDIDGIDGIYDKDDIDDLMRLFNNSVVTNEHLIILNNIIHLCMTELEKDNDVDFMKLDVLEPSILNKINSTAPDIISIQELKEIKKDIISDNNTMKRFLKEIYGKNNSDSVSSFMNKLRAYIIVVNARKLTISDNKDGAIVFSGFDKWNTLHEAILAENKKILETLNTRLEALNASIRIKHDPNIKKQEEKQLLLIEKIKSLKKKLVKLESTKREFIRQRKFLYKNRNILHSILP